MPAAQPVTATPAESSAPWQQPDLFGLQAEPPAEPVAERRQPPDPVSPAASSPAPLGPSLHVPAGRAASPTAAASPGTSSPSLPPIQPAAQPKQLGRAGNLPATLLILDTETTALSPDEGQCIEVGAILFHVAQRAVLAQVSFLLPAPSNPAAHVNGIAAAITQLPQPWQAGLQCFAALLEAADALLAHNAAFDRQWFGHGPLPSIDKPWICSMEDIRWPAERHLRASPSVRDLALAYGVPVWAAHRALTDCIYLAQVLERCPDLEQLLAAALEPRRLFRACLSYSERQQAKEAGFRWNDPVRGSWSRRLSEREAAELPFTVQPLEAA
jgi:DNA polymerase-3 subunit epsilon